MSTENKPRKVGRPRTGKGVVKTISFAPEQWEAVEALAKSADKYITPAAIVRMAVQKMLEENEQKENPQT